MGLFGGILKGVTDQILGPDPQEAASAYQQLQDAMSSRYNQQKQAFEADPANSGKKYQMPDALTRWQDQINGMITSGNPILQQQGLQQLGAYQQRATAAQSGPDMTAAAKDYQLAVQQGYKGSFMDYKRELASIGGSHVSVNVSPGQQLLGLADSMKLVNDQGEHPPVGVPLGQLPNMGYKPMLNDTQRQAATAQDILQNSQATLEQNLNPSATKGEAIANELRTQPNLIGQIVNTGMNMTGMPMSEKATKFYLANKSNAQQKLKLMSGASASEGEMQTYVEMQPKFTDSPEVQKIKAKQGDEFFNAVMARNGQAGIPASLRNPIKPNVSIEPAWSQTKGGHKYRIVE